MNHPPRLLNKAEVHRKAQLHDPSTMLPMRVAVEFIEAFAEGNVGRMRRLILQAGHVTGGSELLTMWVAGIAAELARDEQGRLSSVALNTALQDMEAGK